MSESLKRVFYGSSIILLLAACFLTGGIQSPLRFAYFPLIVLLAFRIGFNPVLRAGFTFSILFVLLVIFDRPPLRQLTDLTAEVFSFFLVSLAAAFVVRILEKERERSENAIATFHNLSDGLKHRTMNLQTTLEALSKAHKQLQETDRAKSRFLANVSHELRTPLSSIRSYSEILLNYDDIDSETRQEFIRIINQESEQMTSLVNENLDLMRIESGKLELNISQVSPTDLLAGGVKVVAPLASEKNIPLVIEVSPDIPAIRGDQQQLTQVLVNLLNNAIKFTSEGRITAGARLKGEDVEFFVADTGEGIFPEEKEIIFQEYYRISDGVSTRPRGSGLGLSIARRIVEYHGGTIRVDSAPGKGSTFYFTLPLAMGEAQPSADEAPKGIVVELGKYGPVLVLSEGIAVRQALRKRLEQLGYQTMGADTPRRCMEIAAGIRPGLIISDISERGDDFLELESWARGAGVEVMLTTLYISPVSGDLCLAINGYLDKPFDRYQIVALVERFLTHKGRFFVVTPVADEARHLQVLLGAEGYGVNIYVGGEEAMKASKGFPPDGVIIGSFPRHGLEDLIVALKGMSQFKSVPFFLVQGGGGGRYAAAVTLDAAAATRKNGGEGISSLIMAVENAYAKKWGKNTISGGFRHATGFTGSFSGEGVGDTV
ncbi:MAG TPA: hybrid sensor histidine kinase/response regulator [Geobacteraceae bacterium]